MAPRLVEDTLANKAIMTRPTKREPQEQLVDLVGLVLKSMICELGAKSLILISKSGMDAAGAADAVEALGRSGAVITVHKCDVADKIALWAVLHECAQTLPPIRGVVQGAMVFKVSLEIFSRPHQTKNSIG